MGRVVSDISMSLDGFIAGANDTQEQPLGDGGAVLHDWLADGADVLGEAMRSTGAIIMGRRSYDQCAGTWWGDSGPAGDAPCFVLTHSPPDQNAAPQVFTFVTDGIESAVSQAKSAAGDKVVGLHGASSAQQALRAGLLDDLRIHLVPVLLGEGVRLFAVDDAVSLQQTSVLERAGVTHLTYRVIT